MIRNAALCIVLILLFLPHCRGQEPPITGKASVKFHPLDAAITAMMDRINSRAATLAVSHAGELLYNRGYGWQDERRKQPTDPEALFRIASCTKPITAAAVLMLMKEKKFDRQTPAMDFLQIKPAGDWGDSRLRQITIGQLLEHRGGWDREATFDPVFKLPRIQRELHLERQPTPTDIVRYMLGQPLQFAPGERSSYSNFGYTVLGRVIEKASGKTYYAALDQIVFRPVKINDIMLGHDDPKERPKREVYYPAGSLQFSIEALDACGGLTASAPALCRFMEQYWLSGEPRGKSGWGNYYFNGSLPQTTALIVQRPDGYNFAALFNARRDEHHDEDSKTLKAQLTEALDAIVKSP